MPTQQHLLAAAAAGAEPLAPQMDTARAAIITQRCKLQAGPMLAQHVHTSQHQQCFIQYKSMQASLARNTGLQSINAGSHSCSTAACQIPARWRDSQPASQTDSQSARQPASTRMQLLTSAALGLHAACRRSQRSSNYPNSGNT